MNQRLDPDAMPKWLASKLATRRTDTSIVAGVDDDDCAVLRWNGELLVASTDYLNARPIVMELGIGGFRTAGRLVVASNLADLCGSGAEPRGLLIAVTMPRKSTESDFREIMKGVRYEAARWNTPVLGGDTKLGRSFAILGVALGAARSERNLFLKYGARPGDILWASGELGSCNAAVLGLCDSEPSRSWREWAIRTLTVPRLPLKQSRALSESGLGRGGTDVSDGLGADLLQLCLASGVGVVVEAEKIRVNSRARTLAKSRSLPPWALAFGTGGDFQFIVTTSARSKRRISAMGFREIGKITNCRGTYLRTPDGRRRSLPTGGHRDVRNMSFVEEIQSLVREAADAPS